MWFGTGRYTGGRSKIDRARKKYGASSFIYEIIFKKTFRDMDEATKGKKKPPGFGDKVSKGLKSKPKTVSHRKKLSEGKLNSGSKIIQYSKLGEYNKTWDNIDIAAKTLQVSRESIAKCCRGECKSIKNFKWKYKEE